MKRLLALACLALLLVGSTADAGMITIDTSKTDLSAPDTFTITVGLQDFTDLAGYSFVILLDGQPGGSDVTSTMSVDQPPADMSDVGSRYVFDSLPADGRTVNIDMATDQIRVGFQDLLTSGGVTTVAGANDLVARLTVHTTAGFFGNVLLSVNLQPTPADAIVLIDSNFDDIPFNPATDILYNGSTGSGITLIGPTAVPEPSSLFLVGLGLAGLGGWRLRRRRRA